MDRTSKACKRADLDFIFKMVNVELMHRDATRTPTARSRAGSRAHSRAGSENGGDDSENGGSEAGDVVDDLPTDFNEPHFHAKLALHHRGSVDAAHPGGGSADPLHDPHTILAQMRRASVKNERGLGGDKTLDDWNSDL